MSDSNAGPIVPLVQRDDFPDESQAIYDHVAETRGGIMPNVFKALANSPGALEKAASVGEFLRFHSSLDGTLRELVIMTVAQQAHCVYEWTHHGRIAKAMGIEDELLNSVGEPDIETRPAPLGPALRYARLVARLEPVAAATTDALKESLGPAGLVELTVLVGYYGMVARVINTLGVPLEEGVKPRPFNV